MKYSLYKLNLNLFRICVSYAIDFLFRACVRYAKANSFYFLLAQLTQWQIKFISYLHNLRKGKSDLFLVCVTYARSNLFYFLLA